MTDIYAVGGSAFDPASPTEPTLVTTMLSALLIIGLPTAFWMGLIELVSVLFGFELGSITRVAIASVLMTLLFAVWCFVVVSARQARNAEINARLAGSPAAVD